jgi:hypothetical protein
MRIRNFWAVATLCGGIAAVSSAQAQQIQVNKWPDDMPCSALQKNGDGSYTLLQPVTFGNDTDNPLAVGTTLPNTGEYSIWATKCG